MTGLFSVAGGVRYHCRGLRHSDRTWSPFRDALSAWLEHWCAGGQRLLIVGPSGGYCLKREWLAKFQNISCLDPDPLARAIFTRRLKKIAPQTKVEWTREDFLLERSPLLQLRKLKLFLNCHPGAPVLFSNFLGQLGLLLHEHRRNVPQCLSVWKSDFVRKNLQNRPWASFHDRFSGEIGAQFKQPYVSGHRLSDDAVLSELYPNALGYRKFELEDHETVGFFDSAREHAYFRWDLTAKWSHLIEATCEAQSHRERA